MEAVPKLPLISFELKTSPENTHFGPKLKQYIAEAYREDPESYSNEIHQLEGLRSAAVRPSLDTTGLSALLRYFCQLRAIQSRFPMAKGQPVACSFAWKDIYANMNCSSADIRFELACILYNIGALLTQLSASEPRTSADSLKAACTKYQNAAWAFQYLREQYPQPPGMDVSTDIMRLFQEICFAQAQECILEKSIQDTKKPSVVGAVATQVLFFYKNSLALLGPSTGTDNIHEIIGTKLYNYWHRYLSFKAGYIGCIVCLYQGMNAEEQQKMGERVAFYQHAAEKLNDARKLAKYIEPTQITQEALNFTNDVVEGKKKAAKNENEFIYHEEVPDKDLLTDLKPVCLVKAIAINLSDPEISGPDIFSRLVPMGAHEASSMYSEEKAKLLRHIVTQVEAKNTELMEFMSSLQLEQIDVLDSDQKIPQEIVDRCAAMNAKTEIIQILVDSMNNLAEIISDVEHSLAEIKNLIQEETAKEKEYQKMMGPRPPSIVQTELSREYHKYQEAHARTTDSNQVLHKAMTLHIANLRLLAQPLDALQAKIPTIDNIEGLDRATMSELRRVVGKAREMQTQRDTLVQQLRASVADDDITSKLLAADQPAEQLFQQELEKHTPKVKIIEQNLAAQENIINRLTSLYASYGDSRRLLSDVLRKREGIINALITSYDTYEELLGKSQKGQEFYKKLAHNVNQLLARLRSTCQVQREEREQMMATHTSKASVPTTSTVSKTVDAAPAPPTGGSRKLKDYLPYMKNRNAPRSITPQSHVDPVSADMYYPESIYPTSVRPTPVGSEATDMSQMKVPDGVVMPPGMQNPNAYNRYATPYAPSDTDPYNVQNYNYAMMGKTGYEKPDENYGYSTYTPSQYSTQISDPQIYTNPYYSATHNNTTNMTDSSNPYMNNAQANVNPSTSQYNPYSDQYGTNQLTAVPESTSTISSYNQNQNDMNVNFAQMQISYPKQEPTPQPSQPDYADYSQTYYTVQYPQSATPNNTTYSHAIQSTNTNMTPSQVPADYSSLNYPYTSAYNQQVQPTPPVEQTPTAYSSEYSYATNAYANTSQGYTIYTNAESAVTSTTSVVNPGVTQPYQYSEPDSNFPSAALSQLDAYDKPIKSHVTGEALSTNIPFHPNYQSFDQNQTYSNPSEQNYQPDSAPGYPDQSMNVNYVQTYQNHPGYTYNPSTGSYDYAYGSQNSYNASYGNVEQPNMDPQSAAKATNLYTSAGACETIQSPSETSQSMVTQQTSTSTNQTYYNAPYGYQTTDQSNETMPSPEPNTTNYGANMNQLTYMQSGQGHDTSVTYASNQVSSPKVEMEEPNFNQTNAPVHNVQPVPVPIEHTEKPVETPVEVKTEEKQEPSVFDLLSDIDFSVEQKPLMPDIKVPQISEKAIIKPVVVPKPEPAQKPVVKEEVIERPAKMDLFSDPMLLNKLTQEMKELRRIVDNFASNSESLDTKWKVYQALQENNNMQRSKSIALQHGEGHKPTAVVPYDDSRLTLKSDPNAFINASYYKQLASWCIPLVISKTPSEREHGIFWKAVLENKISVVVCLLSEIEMQGSSYWPTAKGQCLELGDLKVTLDEVKCTVHWTERKLTITAPNAVAHVTHYQITVFPDKIVCPPIVLLADRIVQQTYEGRLSNQLCGAWVQCGAGGGRCCVLALQLATVCQLRAGQLDLCEMLESCCINLYKHRTNVFEDKKYLVDAYKTALFYVQGVFCSGTTMFNGEAVSVPSGAAMLPPPPAAPATSPPAAPSNKTKFSRESFEEMKQSPGLKSGDMKDPLNFLDPLWSLKKK